MSRTSTRKIDAIRRDAQVMPGRGFRAIIGGLIAGLRRRLHERRCRKAAERWVKLIFPPEVLARAIGRMSYTDLNELRLRVDATWRRFTALPPAEQKEIETWMWATSPLWDRLKMSEWIALIAVDPTAPVTEPPATPS